MSDEKRRKGKNTPGKPGRPAFVDETAKIEKMLAYIKAGNFPRVAARASGIAPRTFYDNMKRGRVDFAAGVDSPEARLFDQVEQAQELGKALLIGRIRLASESPKAWSAAAWILERLSPEEYGQSTKITLLLQQGIDELLDKLEKGLSKDEFARVLDIIAPGGRGSPAPGDPSGDGEGGSTPDLS